jgi:hypothetical protein
MDTRVKPAYDTEYVDYGRADLTPQKDLDSIYPTG